MGAWLWRRRGWKIGREFSPLTHQNSISLIWGDNRGGTNSYSQWPNYPSSCLTCARLTLLLLLFLAMCFLGMGVVMVQVISSFVFFFFFYFYFLERMLTRWDIYSFHSFFRHNLSFLMNLGDCLLFNFFWLVVCHSFFNWTLFF